MKLIIEKDGYALYYPLNTWDMNYHLVDDKGNDYLIDTDEVQNNEEDLDEYGGILWEELRNLECIEDIKDYHSWKTVKTDDSIALNRALRSIKIA